MIFSKFGLINTDSTVSVYAVKFKTRGEKKTVFVVVFIKYDKSPSCSLKPAASKLQCNPRGI